MFALHPARPPSAVCIFPQPIITTRASGKVTLPVSIPIELRWYSKVFKFSSVSSVPLRAETEDCCDHVLAGSPGRIESLARLKREWELFLGSSNDLFTAAKQRDIDAQGLVEEVP
jgi:hypothetical protein